MKQQQAELHFVYALADATGVRYIGHCKNLAGRISIHWGRRQAVRAMKTWIDSIAPMVPIVWVLHVVTDRKEVERLERLEIAQHIKRGAELINIRDRPRGAPPSEAERRQFYGYEKRPAHLVRQARRISHFEEELRRAYAASLPLMLPRRAGEGDATLDQETRETLEALFMEILRERQCLTRAELVNVASYREPMLSSEVDEALRGMERRGVLARDGEQLRLVREAS